MRQFRSWLLLFAVLLGGVACDTIFGDDLLSWDFALPAKQFEIDADNFVPGPLKTTGAVIPTLACTQDECCAGIGAAECETFGLSCRSGACVAVPTVELSNVINLVQEVPELQQVADTVPSFAHVTLKRLYLSAYSNTLNYDTPEIELFLGPEAAAGVDDVDQAGQPLCKKLGTVPPIPTGTSCSAGCTVEVTLTADGAQVFETFVKNFRQTFKMFARATMQLEPGDPIPAGQFTGTVTGTVTGSM